MYQVKNNNSDEMIPLRFRLSQNYPNPFKEKTVIKYCIPYKTKVTITLFNSDYKFIKKLLEEELVAGTYEILFEAFIDISGRKGKLSEGTYYYELRAGNYSNAKEMILRR